MAPSFRALALCAALANAFHLLAGLGHLLGSLGSRAGSPYDFHFAGLMLVGLDVVAPALGQLLLARPLWRGRAWALACSAGVAAYQATMFALVSPFTLGAFASAATVAYLGAACWTSQEERRRRAAPLT